MSYNDMSLDVYIYMYLYNILLERRERKPGSALVLKQRIPITNSSSKSNRQYAPKRAQKCPKKVRRFLGEISVPRKGPKSWHILGKKTLVKKNVMRAQPEAP